MSSPRRMVEKEREREEGRQAFLAGKPMNSCPYKSFYPSWGQWMRGYDTERMIQESERGKAE